MRIQKPVAIDASLQLGDGEREAIALAEELGTGRILLDETKARRVAAARGLTVIGTLAVLVQSAERGRCDLPSAIQALRTTNFYLSDDLIESVLKRANRR